MKPLLIVDDDPEIRALLQMVLESEGFVSETAASGKEALDRQAAAQNSVILLDFTLPDLDGREVFLELRRRGSDVPVVFVTAEPDIEDRVRGLAHSGIVHKPFEASLLIERIRSVLVSLAAAAPAET